jgi:hypothetical protein
MWAQAVRGQKIKVQSKMWQNINCNMKEGQIIKDQSKYGQKLKFPDQKGLGH